jgi:flagellar basal-body rod modification protein FlgD
MAIQSTQTQVSNAAATGNAPPANPTSQMGETDFLKLLVAQLKQQDPNQPMDASQMVAQLAQLSSVQALGGIQKTLTALQTANTGMAGTQAAGLVGRTVSGNANRIDLSPTQAANGQFDLGGQAKATTVVIRDAGNKAVRTLDLGALQPGVRGFQWDGKTDGGTRAPDGEYTFDVAATASNGLPVTASTQVSGMVSQISYSNGSPELLVGSARLLLSDITTIGP